MHLNIKKLLLSALGILALVLFFQNCGDVNIDPHVPVELPSSKTVAFSGEFCSGIPNQGKRLVENFFFVNLTAIAYGESILPDSDIDGIPDSVEESNSHLGFSALNAYSSGILDGICFNQGGVDCVPVSCSDELTPISLGLLQCDATAISSSSELTGVDTDQDGIPDWIEVLKRLDPLRALIDEDTDMLPDGTNSNIDEIQRGTDPASQAQIPRTSEVNASFQKLSSSSTGYCQNQDLYSFYISSFPILEVKAYSNPYFPELSHSENENVFIAFYISKPLNTNETAQIFYKLIKVHKDSGDPTLIINPEEFELLGEYLF